MPSRKITDLVQILQDAFNYGLKTWGEVEGITLTPFLTCTYRSNEEQTALYAQGRSDLNTVNGLRHNAALPPISENENHVITNARAGQSKHNSYPAKAFDIAFKDQHGNLNWDKDNYKKFAEMIEVKFPSVIWGGDWNSIKDTPHFEIH